MTPEPMATWNLALRFGLEVATMAGFATAAWRLGSGPVRWSAVVGVPVVAAVVWSIFNVPGDPSRSGEAPVEVAGVIRLALELAILAGGVAALATARGRDAAVALAALIVFHYVASLPRIEWLLQSRDRSLPCPSSPSTDTSRPRSTPSGTSSTTSARSSAGTTA